jgi:hypothetical protein
MNSSIDQLAKSILQKDTLEQCSVKELQQVTDQYPYFGAAQLLLAKKLQAENSKLYDRQLQKTSLLFYNPLWLEHMLNNTGHAEIIKTDSVDPAPAAIAAFESVQDKKEEETVQEEPVKINTELIDIPGEKEPGQVEVSIQNEPALPVKLPAFNAEPVDPGKVELSFEPYHTVDYFASQGIKFKEEEHPKDKFGQQLKSFTEWLKTLKRLPVSETAETIEVNVEQKVEQLAGQSLQDREVITETMAEVWEKQGNTAKAIDIYNKLSLLDPSKRPYFAAKIEALKKIN